MNDIDFTLIKPRQGSKFAAFEELCCQLARRVSDETFIRAHGKGGDGGVECHSDSETGRVAWQAKFVFDVNSLLQKAMLSLEQAKINHPQLKKYILCFPFDLTGPTSRTKKGNSGSEKFEKWRDEQTKLALQIELQPDHRSLSSVRNQKSNISVRQLRWNSRIFLWKHHT